MHTSNGLETNTAFLSTIVGERVSRVALDEHAIVVLIGSAEIRIEGDWVLLAGAGDILDGAAPFHAREHFELWRIVGSPLVTAELADEENFELILRFEPEWELRAVSDEDGLEDWSVTHPDFRLIAEGRQLTLFRTSSGCSGEDDAANGPASS